MPDTSGEEGRIGKIKRDIKALQARWPAHGASPALMAELDSLESELRQLQHDAAGRSDDAQNEDRN